MLPKYSWMQRFPLECGWLIRSYRLTENWLSLFQKLSIANIFSAKTRTSCPILQSMLGFSLFGAFTNFVPAITSRVGSYVQLPCCVQKKLFPYFYLPPLTFKLITFPLPQWLLHLGEKCAIHMFHLWLILPITSLHLSQLWVSGLITIYYKKKFLWWVLSDLLIYRYKIIHREIV